MASESTVTITLTKTQATAVGRALEEYLLHLTDDDEPEDAELAETLNPLVKQLLGGR